MEKYAEVAVEYQEMLNQLTCNSKPLIDGLSQVAGEQKRAAGVIAPLIEKGIRKAPPELKLPHLYTMDSIVKNIKEPYVSLFKTNLPQLFVETYQQLAKLPAIQQKVEKLFNTWHQQHVFPPSLLAEIEKNLPQLRMPHMNPKFAKQTTATATPSNSAVAPPSNPRNQPPSSSRRDPRVNPPTTQTISTSQPPSHPYPSGPTNSDQSRELSDNTDPRADPKANAINGRIDPRNLPQNVSNTKHAPSSGSTMAPPSMSYPPPANHPRNNPSMPAHSGPSSSFPPNFPPNLPPNLPPNFPPNFPPHKLTSSGDPIPPFPFMPPNYSQPSPSDISDLPEMQLPDMRPPVSNVPPPRGFSPSHGMVTVQPPLPPFPPPHAGGGPPLAHIPPASTQGGDRLQGPGPSGAPGGGNADEVARALQAAGPSAVNHLLEAILATGTGAQLGIPTPSLPTASSASSSSASAPSPHHHHHQQQHLHPSSHPQTAAIPRQHTPTPPPPPPGGLPLQQQSLRRTGSGGGNMGGGGGPSGDLSHLLGSLLDQGVLSLDTQHAHGPHSSSLPPPPPPVLSNEIELANSRAPLGSSFSPAVLKARDDAVVRSLYSLQSFQCHKCGLRFCTQAPFSAHMDWHKLKDKSSPCQQRQWCVPLPQWLEGAKEAGRPTLGAQEQSHLKNNEDVGISGGEVAEEEEDEEMNIPMEDEGAECVLCGEEFSSFWNMEEDHWQLEGAWRVTVQESYLCGVAADSIIHKACRPSTNLVKKARVEHDLAADMSAAIAAVTPSPRVRPRQSQYPQGESGENLDFSLTSKSGTQESATIEGRPQQPLILEFDLGIKRKPSESDLEGKQMSPTKQPRL